MFGRIGLQELIVIFLVILLLFGAKNIPEIAKGIGRSIREFKKALHETEKEINATQDEIRKA